MTTVPLAQVRDALSSFVSSVEQTHDRVAITRNGRVVAFLVSPDDLGALEETVAVLSEPPFLQAITAVRAEQASGGSTPLDAVLREQSKHSA